MHRPTLIAALALLLGCGASPAHETSAHETMAPSIAIARETPLTLEVVVVLVLDANQAEEPRELTRRVSRAYARYVHATRLVTIRREARATLEGLGDIVRASVAAGTAPVIDETTASAASDRARLALVAAEDDARVAERELAAILLQPEEAGLPPPADLTTSWVLASPEALIAQARQHRPGEPVEREVTEACARLTALIEAWRGQPAGGDETVEAMTAMYRVGTRALADLILAIDGQTGARVSELDLALRIADASADVEHAVGARLTREPLPAD